MNPTLLLPLVCAVPMPFGLRQDNGVWAFTRPDGGRFWSLGCDCVDTGTPKEKYQTGNPSYSSSRLFVDDAEWADNTLGKLRTWGFNSLGGWSDTVLFRRRSGSSRLPFFTVLHVGAWDRAPWEDMFDPKFERLIEQAADSEIPKVRDDPELVGYFTDNELGWWGDTLFLTYLKMPASSPGHRALVSLLRRHYHGSWASLAKDWNASGDSFNEPGTMTLRPGGGGMRVIGEWTEALATRYYSVVSRAIRRRDAKRLVLGDRFCQYWDANVVRASRPFVDAVSTNYGCEWTDGGLSRFFLDSLHAVTGKPVIVTEFYANAIENRSGNRNSAGGFPLVRTQEERAACVRRNVEELARRPYVVGAHWFQFYDEPTHGRGDGEDCNMGLVDVQGRPYDELTTALGSLDPWNIHRGAQAFHPSGSIPQAPANPARGLRWWPRDSAWVQPATGVPFADLYLCRDREALYVGLISMDYMDEALYADEKVPESERSTLTLKLGDTKPLVVRFGGKGRSAFCSSPATVLKEWPGLKHSVVMKVPIRHLARSIAVAGSLTQHSRAARMSWKTLLAVRSDQRRTATP